MNMDVDWERTPFVYRGLSGNINAPGARRAKFHRSLSHLQPFGGMCVYGIFCLSPSFLCPLRVDPLALYPTLPWSPSEICPEVVFSDDRTLLGRYFEGLGQLLEANCQSCLAVGGSANNLKLKA